MSRPSIYLESKCNALCGAIDFFTGETCIVHSRRRRKLIFLAQIEFWDWEMDELIYSCTSFKERAEAWQSGAEDLDKLLRVKGIVIPVGVFHDISWWREVRNSDDVVAPLKQLNYVIERWNKLLDLCVSTVFDKNIEKKKEQFGLQALSNLDKFKKKIVPHK